MNKNLLFLFLALTTAVASCKKDNTIEDAANKKISDIVVPASFAWQTSRDINFSIGISDTRFQNRLHVVAIYLSDPAKGGVPVSKGAASLISPFNTKISIPSTINEAYIVKIAPDGSTSTEKVALTSAKVSIALSSTSTASLVSGLSLNAQMADTNGEPNCSLTTTPSNGANLDIANSSTVLCLTPTSDVTINLNANNGGTLKINAPGKTVTFGNFNHTNLKIYIASNTTVKFNNDLNLSSTEVIVNNGTLNGNNLNSAGSLINNSTATFTGGNFNINNGGTITNAGTFTATGGTANFNGVFTNTHFATFNNVTVNSTGGINNYCRFTVTSDLTVNKTINNYKLFTVGGNTHINSDSNPLINLINGAMFLTKNMDVMDGNVSGSGSPVSLFKVTGSIGDNVLNNNGYFKGTVQFCGTKDIEVNQNNKKHFSDGATKGCGTYIENDGSCNNIGNGTAPAPVKPDTDGDGIIDEQDAYPTDPTKAFNSYSVNYANGGSTVAFEDSWPLKGDYDLNDVVLTYKFLVATSAQNKVVTVQAEWRLLATGGNFRNGAGIQFNLPASSITNFTASNALAPEAGQDSLVVILFKDSREQQATWNTRVGEAVSPSKTFTFSFNVTNGPTLESFGLSSYNPFIWNNTTGYGRGYEAHLYGKYPTKLADITLFGTGDDSSLTGKYYATSNKLPWAIELPVSQFLYPIEKSAVTSTYLKFSDWASSGGTTSLDWFTNTATGYRNNSFIYGAN
ncbi:MAG: LruC domain-containing protein [Pedobacter sp.]|nr:MAG: LruC domain-containing protein [Pedobacter sp.]